MSVELLRHVNALVSDLAAEHGEVDLVGRRVDCDPDDRDALVETFEAYGVVGGAGVRVRDPAGQVLLVQYEHLEGWIDPGDGRLPGESYRECARRAVLRTAAVETTVDGLAQVHLLFMDDWTDREPVPNPYVCFDGSLAGDDPVETANPPELAAEGVVEVRWAAEVPDDLGYGELAELSLGE